jgi:hypothetical protein
MVARDKTDVILDEIRTAVVDAITDEVLLSVTAAVGLGDIARVATEVTRPSDTTAYTAGDAVNNSTSAPVVITLANVARANDTGGYIVGVRLSTDKKSIVPRLRVHFYRASNPNVPNDNAAMVSLYADESKKLGYVDLPAMITPADATNSTISFAQDYSVRIPFLPVSGGRAIYAALETRDAFTPASGEKFTLTVLVDQN